MDLSLNSDTQKLIEKRVRSGDFATAEDFVTAAVRAFEQNEPGEFAPGELDALVEEGEASGEALDGMAVLAELRKLRDVHRRDPS